MIKKLLKRVSGVDESTVSQLLERFLKDGSMRSSSIILEGKYLKWTGSQAAAPQDHEGGQRQRYVAEAALQRDGDDLEHSEIRKDLKTSSTERAPLLPLEPHHHHKRKRLGERGEDDRGKGPLSQEHKKKKVQATGSWQGVKTVEHPPDNGVARQDETGLVQGIRDAGRQQHGDPAVFKTEPQTSDGAAWSDDDLWRFHEKEEQLRVESHQPTRRPGKGEGAEIHIDLSNKHLRDLTWAEDVHRRDVKHGRYTAEEESKLWSAILEYADSLNMPTDDFDWILGADSEKQVAFQKGALKTLAAALPNRNRASVQSHILHMLHKGNNLGRWTKEEDEALLKFVQQRGRRWAAASKVVGRMSQCCKDRYKYIKNQDMVNTSRTWAPEEDEKLKKLILEYISMSGRKEPRHIKARFRTCEQTREDAREKVDDVDWEFIGDQMKTRNYKQCRDRWYRHLRKTAAVDNESDRETDEVLLSTLLATGVENEWEVEWSEIMPGKTSREVKRRWHLLKRQIPLAHEKTLPELVDLMVGKVNRKAGVLQQEKDQKY